MGTRAVRSPRRALRGIMATSVAPKRSPAGPPWPRSTTSSIGASGRARPPTSASRIPGCSARRYGGSRGGIRVNPDFRDILRALCDADARFLVVGAYAFSVHAEPRATGDLDIWVEATAENARRVYQALRAFGARLPDGASPEARGHPDVDHRRLVRCRLARSRRSHLRRRAGSRDWAGDARAEQARALTWPRPSRRSRSRSPASAAAGSPSTPATTSGARRASRLKREIAERLACGGDGETILAAVRTRYGEKVLSSPTLRGFDWLAWVTPVRRRPGGRVRRHARHPPLPAVGSRDNAGKFT